jgi:hypothetical protein
LAVTVAIDPVTEEDVHMGDPPPYPDSEGETGDETGVGPDRESKPGMPRWVKVSGIIVGVLVVLVVVLALTGVLGGKHGPGRHVPGGDEGPPGVTEPGAIYRP